MLKQCIHHKYLGEPKREFFLGFLSCANLTHIGSVKKLTAENLNSQWMRKSGENLTSHWGIRKAHSGENLTSHWGIRKAHWGKFPSAMFLSLVPVATDTTLLQCCGS